MDQEDFEAAEESEEEMQETHATRAPLITPAADTPMIMKISPSSSDRGQSLTEKIRAEQKSMAKVLQAAGASPNMPSGTSKEAGTALMESWEHSLSHLTRLIVPKLQNKFQAMMEE